MILEIIIQNGITGMLREHDDVKEEVLVSHLQTPGPLRKRSLDGLSALRQKAPMHFDNSHGARANDIFHSLA